MIRRSLLRGVGGALAAASAAKASTAAAKPGLAPGLGHLLQPVPTALPVCSDGPDEARKWSHVDALQLPTRRAERRAQLELALLNGMPPHIGSMHSTAPWFRAQMAARWIEAREHERQGLLDRLRRQVFGDT